MRLEHRGLALDVPRGWDARIYRRREDGDGSRTHAVLHTANFALPEGRGDFGSNAVERMGSAHTLVCLLEYGAEAAHTPLFANAGLPRELPEALFSPTKLQRTLAGQAGTQVFFTEKDRAFCLYVVLGSSARRATLVPQVNDVLARLEVTVPGVPR